MGTKKRLSAVDKAHRTAKWARTMTKWLATYSARRGARWHLVGFEGKAKAESRGVVDLVAIRKDHRRDMEGVKRGDLFEIVLIQTKGGSARRPTPDDVARFRRVARYHRARAVILAEWRQGSRPYLSKFSRGDWSPVSPEEVFG
jgi:hypothetical protein